MLECMAIRDWPSDERPREKLLDKGAAALSDAELLAVLLRTGMRGRSALDLARDVLRNFHSLRKLIAADRSRFCAEPGLGPARFAELQAAVEISRRQLSESLRAVISQTLLKRMGGGRVAAHEIMIGTPAIRNLIREGKIAQMYSSIQTGQSAGMQTLDQCLAELVSKGAVSKEEARYKAQNKDAL